jgi:predicted RNase H-like nuclease
LATEDPRIVPSFTDVLDEKPAFSVIALRAPVGFLDKAEPRGRTCDREARSLLGRRRGAAVQSAPAWPAFTDEGSARTDGLDAVTLALFPRYAEVAREMAPYLQRTVYEAHPELSFFQLNHDQPCRYSKRFVAGQLERRELLDARIPGVERIVDAQVRGAKIWHLLDAAACLWTARRILARAATRVPADPEWDTQGLRMEIVR